MRFSESFIKSSTKVLAIAGLAIVSSAVFAAGDTSIVNALNNDQAVNNTAISPMKDSGNKDGKGDSHSNDHTGDKGKGAGGDDKGGKSGGGMPPGCVPEPCSMLAMGLGAGFMALKRRRAAKNAA
jgi:hypothetical protein